MATQRISFAPQQEIVSCHVCSGQEYTAYLDARGYTIVRCDDCGLLYVNPQPDSEELEKVYSEYDSGEQWRRGEEHFNRSIRGTITRFKKGGVAMDVGSGSGNFLRCLRAAGFQVFGVEPSQSGSEYAQSTHGIETFNGTIESFIASGAGGGRRFDVITLLNVLEHLKRPAAVLDQLRQVLHETGILVIVVPDAHLHALVGETRRRLGFKDPFWMDTFRHPLVAFDPPHHLCSFEPSTISEFVVRCGFKPIYIRNAPVVFNDDSWKNAAKLFLRAFSESLYWATFRRVILGYSTLIVCQKA